MKKFISTSIGFLLVLLIQAQSISQQVVGTSGESFENGTVSISWTIGEVAVETFEQNGLILTQGFHQGYFEITSVEELPLSDIIVKVYPNPARDYIKVDVQNNDDFDIVAELFDLQGRLIRNGYIEKNAGTIEIDLNGLSASQYILRISKNTGEPIQTFKLIKK